MGVRWAPAAVGGIQEEDTLQRTDCFRYASLLKILGSDLEGKYDFAEEGNWRN